METLQQEKAKMNATIGEVEAERTKFSKHSAKADELLQIARGIESRRELETLFDTVFHDMRSLVGAERASLFLARKDPHTGIMMLHTRVGLGLTEEIVLPFGEGVYSRGPRHI